MMEIKKAQWIGIIFAVITFGISLLFVGENIFFLLIGIAIIIGASPFVTVLVKEAKEDKEKEGMFLEFARDLVESVKTGTPISKSIINVSKKKYGVLTSNVQKLGNQISLGIPLNKALQTFAKDVNNSNVSKAIVLIGEAERTGGEIGQILESVADSVSTSEKLKKERQANISTLIVQGYIIFFIFIIIILVVQFKIVPMLSEVSSMEVGSGLGGQTAGTGADQDLSDAFFYLLIVQGFFSGLVIGKLAEENIKAGVKHSFALVIIAFLVSSIARIIAG